VPIVVAINKVDKENANEDKVKKELAELDLNPEEWGGKTVVVPISALKKKGINELMEMVLLTADVNPPKAVVDRSALGSVIESHLDKNLGPLATILVHTGSLEVGNDVVAGRVSGRVRRLIDFQNKPINTATPSMPVTVVGLNDVPAAGDILQAVEKKGEAVEKASQRRAPVKKVGSVDESDERKILALVIKADSRGSVEAIEQTIESMMPPEVRLSIIRADVGAVSDSDVLTAKAADAIIYAFNVNAAGMAKRLSEKEHVPVKMFDVIYRLSEDVRIEIENRLPVELVRTDLGKLKVLKTFFSTQKKRIVGGDITEGKIEVDAQLIIWRKEGKEKTEVGKGKILEMQRGKQEIKKAEKGDQVGLTVEGSEKIKEGDVLEIYKEEEVRKESKIKA
jgi:translation initiation factor IF-2